MSSELPEHLDKLKRGTLKRHELPPEQRTMGPESIEACLPQTWLNILGSTFNVRKPPNYSETRAKTASSDALFEVYAIDVYKTEQKVAHFGRLVDMQDDPEREELGVPTNFIINWMVPNYAPTNPLSLWSAKKEDGEGFSMVFYARMTDRTKAELRKPEDKQASAVKLLKNFILSDPSSDLRKRFKIIARIMNSDDVEFNFVTRKLLNTYNAQPFLARTTTTFFRTDKYFEIDVDTHRFGYPAKSGLVGVKEKVGQIIFDFGFVIEGHGDEEQPEQILMCARVSKATLGDAVEFPYQDEVQNMAPPQTS